MIHLSHSKYRNARWQLIERHAPDQWVYSQAQAVGISAAVTFLRGVMAILINKDNKLLEIACYVVLNPMRFKGMVCRLDDWLWSSYLAMVGNVPKLGWLATDWLLYMIKPEGSDLSGFISIKEAETID